MTNSYFCLIEFRPSWVWVYVHFKSTSTMNWINKKVPKSCIHDNWMSREMWCTHITWPSLDQAVQHCTQLFVFHCTCVYNTWIQLGLIVGSVEYCSNLQIPNEPAGLSLRSCLHHLKNLVIPGYPPQFAITLDFINFTQFL